MITPQLEKEWKLFAAGVRGTVQFNPETYYNVENKYTIHTSSGLVKLVWSNQPDPAKSIFKTVAKSEFWIKLQSCSVHLEAYPNDLLTRTVMVFKRNKCKVQDSELTKSYRFISDDCKKLGEASHLLKSILFESSLKDNYIQTEVIENVKFLVLHVNALLWEKKMLSHLYDKCCELASKLSTSTNMSLPK